jgi:hypothetical protein
MVMQKSALRFAIHILLVTAAIATVGCGSNRASARIYGASSDFVPTETGFIAQTHTNLAIRVANPTDARLEHIGEPIAGTIWQGCDTDASFGNRSIKLVQENIEKELYASGLFSETQDDSNLPVYALHTEVLAFCSEVKGFMWLDVAGIFSANFTLLMNGEELDKFKIESVVTDEDPEYTGAQAGFIEQAMKWTMSDALREATSDLLMQIDLSLSKDKEFGNET